MKGKPVKVAALIPAAGSGTRLGLGPKAFVPVEGRTLLGRSAAALAPHVHEVLIALPAGLTLPGDVPGRAVVGGDTRQASVLALLRATDADVVLIHDAARPFLPSRVIRDLLAAVQDTGAATAAMPVADTLVRADPAGGWGTLTPREGLWAVQTPQAFRRAALIAAHEAALADAHAATDDAGLIARAGQPVALVPGDARLLKVTTPGDLLIAQALARVWDAGAS